MWCTSAEGNYVICNRPLWRLCSVYNAIIKLKRSQDAEYDVAKILFDDEKSKYWIRCDLFPVLYYGATCFMRSRECLDPMNHFTIDRRQFVKTLSTGITFAAAARNTLPNSASPSLVWYNVRDYGIEGKGWNDTLRYFDRFPGKAESTVPERVWTLSRHSAGMLFRFTTDAVNIHVRYTLLSDRLEMPHMPATGVSGIDLYAENEEGLDRWVAVVKPTGQTVDVILAEGLRPGSRRYTMYLPLYNGIESLEIGLDESASFEGHAPRTDLPIVFYGTSIMHGASASRPGMAIPAILGRRLNVPTINLGFSGSGKMEPEVGALVAEMTPCVFAIDCVPNMDEGLINERLNPLVKQLRRAHSKTPILLVEDRAFTNAPFFPERAETHRKNRHAFHRTYKELLEEGVSGLYYLNGEHLLGHDGEAATDGSHPNDLGMVRYADAYEPALRAILNRY